MIFTKIVFIYIIVININIGCSCPTGCDQDSCKSGLMLCSKTRLATVPLLPPKHITKVIITKQNFVNPVLGYRNLSNYGVENIELNELTLRNCGISDIESESFSHLINLKMLDLSQNRIKVIRPRTFKALNLKILKLSGNKMLTLTRFSLKGLVVSKLYLADCGLSQLQFDPVNEISGHLTQLDLAHNRLHALSDKFYLLFRRLEVLQLADNQFRCDCRLKWLSNVMSTKTKLVARAVCAQPARVRGRAVSELAETEFLCPLPLLERLHVDVVAPDAAVLTCFGAEATADEDKVIWLPAAGNGEDNTTLSLSQHNRQATIRVRQRAGRSHSIYSCLVRNNNGNVSVDVSITWPPPSRSSSGDLAVTSLSPSRGGRDGGDPEMRYYDTNNGHHRPAQPAQQQNYLFLKQFTLFELLLSIASTFVITIIVFCLIYLLLSRKCAGKQRHHCAVVSSSLTNSSSHRYQYSRTHTAGVGAGSLHDSQQQIYDVPHHLSSPQTTPHSYTASKSRLYPAHPANAAAAAANLPPGAKGASPNMYSAIIDEAHTHLIDFKTQRPFSPS